MSHTVSPSQEGHIIGGCVSHTVSLSQEGHTIGGCVSHMGFPCEEGHTAAGQLNTDCGVSTSVYTVSTNIYSGVESELSSLSSQETETLSLYDSSPDL